MLINLANHPSSDWGKAQMDKAIQMFGSVTDMNFPAIDPEWDLEVVSKTALQYAKSCLNMLEKSSETAKAIHVMGELSFCFQFVRLMQQQGITCLASTTQRITKNTINGKLSKFDFIRFRNYF